MSKHGTSPEFERKLQELAAETAHMVVPRSDVQRPLTEMGLPDGVIVTPSGKLVVEW